MKRTSMDRAWTWTSVVAAGLLVAACEPQSSSTSPAATGTDTAASPTPSQTDTTGSTTKPPDKPATCDGAKALGSVTTSAADIIFNSGTVNSSVVITPSHVTSSGCVNAMDVKLSIDGGCKLTLGFTTKGGTWWLTSGAFVADAKCGTEWPSAANDAYTLDLNPKLTAAAVLNVPAPGEPSKAESCLTLDGVKVVGRAEFYGKIDPNDPEGKKQRRITVTLNDLRLAGGTRSNGVDAGGCPKAIQTCVGLTCGQDPLGNECGTCGEGTTCAGGACVAKGCVKAGDGKVVGSHIGDISWPMVTGSYELHTGCKSTATWIVKTAGWCYWCSVRAPEFQALYDQYHDQGVQFLLLVGQDKAGKPATASYAAQYKKEHKYQDGWISIGDPDWKKLESKLEIPSDGTPAFAVLDEDMVLRFAQSNQDFSWAAQQSLIKILNGQ